ncbi:hypothetical protein DSD19_17995 [Rhodovulum sp. BSW8]|uniref:Uncharacterized protein n=1 Tax=Rhodovulum visakhapatnamense TaxID=364297 RepID=A0A4R8FVN8_9RHOB|nr:hypothetical protein [Rhodovulum]RBO51703.1 hypothetical protein DSD19_17995 [Rhodovulum sp. BSW8]TDX30607.1 hypothetical protein EV657_10691 [Rhodovulum visakhapatnamense]
MVRILCIALILVVSACDSPGMDYAGIPPVMVEIDGSRFAVRRKGGEAQAIRLNREYRAGTMARAFRAIETGSGCAIRPDTLRGDPAVAYARLTCPGA